MPDQRREVVVNATPIISLALIGQLNLLQRLYGNVVIPPAIAAEVAAGGPQGIGVAELQTSPWIQVRPLSDPTRADLISDLDRGEAEVIALAQELNADLVILDERLGRQHARRLGLRLTGTLGVLLLAKRRGLVSEVRPLIQMLVEGGIRLGERLIAETLRLAGEA